MCKRCDYQEYRAQAALAVREGRWADFRYWISELRRVTH